MQIELSPKQCEFIRNATHRYNGKIGATQCGKTFIDIAYVIVNRILERKGKNGLNLILGVTKETIERNVLEPMRDQWGAEYITEINSRNVCHIFGEKVYCLGGEKVSQVSKLRGAKFKYIYIDELVEINQQVFELLKSRLSLPYSTCDFTGNPGHPKHYVKKFIDSKADVYCQGWTIYDNPFLDPQRVKELEIEYKGTVYFDRYILGEWRAAEGIIYRDFADSLQADPDKYIISDAKKYLAKTRQTIVAVLTGVDFGGSKSATVFVASLITSKREVIAVMEEYIAGSYGETETPLDPAQLNQKYIAFVRKVISQYGRGLTYADSAEQILIRGLYNTAIRNKLPAVKNALKLAVTDRIRMFTFLMAKGRFHVVRDCTHVIDALSSAVWNSKKIQDVRLDDGTSDIDTLDALEYSAEPFYKELVGGEQNNSKRILEVKGI